MGKCKTEWIEPSYGCCYMTEEDCKAFYSLRGSASVILPLKQRILKKYESQYPFNGDGKLFDITNWEDYEKDLPLTIKINSPSQEEQKGKAKLIQTISNNSTMFQSGMARSMPSVSDSITEMSIIENKQSTDRKQEEGVINSTGNQLKGTALPTSPDIEESVKQISFEFKDAKNKNENSILSTLNDILDEATQKITEQYSKLKENFEKYKAQIERYKTQVANFIKARQATILQTQRQLTQKANEYQQIVSDLQQQIIQSSQQALTTAITSISGALEGLASLILTPLGFSAITLGALGSAVGSTSDARVVTCSYPNGVTKDGCPTVGSGFGQYSVGDFAGYTSQCYKPTNLSDIASINRARQDAVNFAQQVNGYVWNDCTNARFVVFYNPPGGEE